VSLGVKRWTMSSTAAFYHLPIHGSEVGQSQTEGSHKHKEFASRDVQNVVSLGITRTVAETRGLTLSMMMRAML